MAAAERPPRRRAGGRGAREGGAAVAWYAALADAAGVYEAVRAQAGELVAQYAVPMAYHVRCSLRMNAREAMHVLELRTPPQGHPSYRRLCQEMHRLIREEAGHRAIAAAMSHVDHEPSAVFGRLAAEQRSGAQRRRPEGKGPPSCAPTR